MTVKELTLKNRSYRRFDESKKISLTQLENWVDLARQTPSGANKQPLKYALVASEEANEQVFQTLKWAAYFSDWDGPIEGEKPAAYIAVLQDKNISPALMGDQGIPVQTLLMAAVEEGYGGCILGNVDRPVLSEFLKLPSHLEIIWVVALGVPNEEIRLVEVKESGDIKYYRDDKDIHYVPKRSLKEVVVTKI